MEPDFFEHREMTPAFDGHFTIENRYAFTNLNQCTFSWELKKWNVSAQPEAIKGNAIASNIKPLEKGTLNINLPKNWRTFDVLYIKANSPEGKEIFTWSFPIVLRRDIVAKELKTTATSKLKSTRDRKNF